MKVVLDTPQHIEKLRKVYRDSVTFITDTESYPFITALEFTGDYLSAMKKRAVPVKVGKKVDKEIARYNKRMDKAWNSTLTPLVDSLKLENLSKSVVEKDTTLSDVVNEKDPRERARKYRQYLLDHRTEIIQSGIDELKEDLKNASIPAFVAMYLLGKNRGQVLTDQELSDDLTKKDREALREKEVWNEEYLDGLTEDVHDNYMAALAEEYESDEEILEALRQAGEKEKHRLPLFAAAVGSVLLAAGMRAAAEEVRAVDPDTGELTDLPRLDPDTDLPVGAVIVGGIWHTSHDDSVCDGCEEQDGRWMTWEDFEQEAGTNDCLTRCRCIELFEPTEELSDKSEQVGDVQKGGPGSGNHGHAGRPGLVGGSGEGIGTTTESTSAVPTPRQIGNTIVRYDETSYNPANVERHNRIEQYINEEIPRIPEAHRKFITEVIIDDDISDNLLPDGRPAFSTEEKKSVKDIVAYNHPRDTKIVFNASLDSKHIKPDTYKGTLYHELGHKIYRDKVLVRIKSLQSEGRNSDADAFWDSWASAFNTLGKENHSTRRILRGNELAPSASERAAGLYRLYMYNGQALNSRYPEVYALAKTQWFDGKEYRRGRELNKSDEPEIYDYVLANGLRVYFTEPQPHLEASQSQEDLLTKHLPGQHDQLSHAGTRTAQDPVDAAQIAASKVEAAKSAEKVIADQGPEFAQKLSEYRERLRTGTQTRDLHKKDGVYTPERKALHQKIVDEFTKNVTPSQSPTFTLMGGLPGSGKSSIVNEKNLNNTVRIDSDEVKMRLPEYEGWNAGLCQLEADDVVAQILVQAASDKKDILLDGTLKNYDKANRMMDVMGNLGYKTGVIFSNVSPENSMRRAVARFQKTGRLVDPMYIASHDHQNINSYERLKNEVDFAELYDNDQQGVPPQLKERYNASPR